MKMSKLVMRRNNPQTTIPMLAVKITVDKTQQIPHLTSKKGQELNSEFYRSTSLPCEPDVLYTSINHKPNQYSKHEPISWVYAYNSKISRN